MNTKIKAETILLSFMSVTILAGFQTTNAHALQLVKVNRKAAKGQCLPERKDSVRSVLRLCKTRLFTGNNKKPTKRNKEGVSRRREMSSSDGRAKATANVLYTVDNIGDGRFKAHEDVRLVFGNPGRSSRTSRRTKYDLQLNPGSQNMRGTGRAKFGGTDNRALIAHELGHHVGKLLYRAYFDEIKRPCKLTRYARYNRREEFAEVFAAYITNPSLFNGKGKRCRKAFEFWAEQFGEENIEMSCESRLNSLSGSSEKSGAVKTSPVPVARPSQDLTAAEVDGEEQNLNMIPDDYSIVDELEGIPGLGDDMDHLLEDGALSEEEPEEVVEKPPVYDRG